MSERASASAAVVPGDASGAGDGVGLGGEEVEGAGSREGMGSREGVRSREGTGSREGVRSAGEIAAALVASIEQVFWGKTDVVKMAVACLMARGHLLVEDVPGVGKTTLAKALAQSAGGAFRRIQFTADLLPSDILGVTVYDQRSGEFFFKPGPIFANLVLADEINRATPRTQSALLEAMSEGQVSVDAEGSLVGGAAAGGGDGGAGAGMGGMDGGAGMGRMGGIEGGATDVDTPGRLRLPQPFMVIATQNPQEQYGTYPLPESQMDRFLLRVRVGYPDSRSEGRIVAGGWRAVNPERLRAVTRPGALAAVQERVDGVRVAEPLVAYVMRVVRETRRQSGLALGVSTRGAMAWVQAARAWAVLEGREYVIPDDLKGLAMSALAHRVVLTSQHESVGRVRAESERLVGDILRRVPLPE